jgi:cell division protease FtsH
LLRRITILLAALLCGALLLVIPGVRGYFAAMDATTQVLLCAFTAVLALVLIFRPRAGAAEKAGAFRGAKPITDAPALTLEDVAACEDAKDALGEICDYLRNPERFARYGARMPRGVLLYGPPGTGKTLLARACAGEAGVPFFALSGSDFVQMYVGVGASRVRELFRKARSCGRSVIFIDEIDAIGARRHEGGADERDQTINALLTEMSGFRPSDGVIVIAATNRLDVLDPALTRPGRFDRKIEVALPDRAQREQILRLHARGKPLDAGVSLGALAMDTAMFSGAALEHLLNEAAVRAARRNSGCITRDDIDAAFLCVTVGGEHAQRLDARELRQTAVHEAGHALLTRLLEPDSRLRRLSILPTGGALNAAGYSMSIPRERSLHTRRALENRLSILLAGRAAEELVFGADEVSTGAANDIARATELAAQMVRELGMRGQIANMPALGISAGGEVTALLEERYRAALEVLRAGLPKLLELTQALVREEALDERRLGELLGEVEIREAV